MSNAAINWAFAQSVGRATDKLVLVCLANFADDDGLCYPSQAKIVQDTSLDRKTVIVALRRLAELGLILDTGERMGTTHQIIVHKLGLSGLFQIRERPVIPAKVSRKQPETVPKTPKKKSENGTRNPQEPSGTIKEPPESGTGLFSEPLPDLVTDAVKIWNEVCGRSCGTVQKITKPRQAAVRARLREDFDNDLKKWRAYCRQIADNPGLTGANDRAWAADFDWAVKPANVVKVLEGKYHRWGRDPPSDRDPTFLPGGL